jgi:hypothetical protein
MAEPVFTGRKTDREKFAGAASIHYECRAVGRQLRSGRRCEPPLRTRVRCGLQLLLRLVLPLCRLPPLPAMYAAPLDGPPDRGLAPRIEVFGERVTKRTASIQQVLTDGVGHRVAVAGGVQGQCHKLLQLAVAFARILRDVETARRLPLGPPALRPGRSTSRVARRRMSAALRTKGRGRATWG